MKISSPKAINWTLKQYGYADVICKKTGDTKVRKWRK
jgi:hypothetical protein